MPTPRDNRCMYMAHTCFLSVVMGCGYVCCVAAVVKDSEYKGCDDVVFSVCIVMREM